MATPRPRLPALGRDLLFAFVAFGCWLIEHPKTVAGLIQDETDRQWKQIFTDLEMEDTPANRESVGTYLTDIIRALQGVPTESECGDHGE